MNTLIAITLSSAVAGLTDMAASGTLRRMQGTSLTALLQFVASGALGSAAFGGGLRTATIGLFFHFLIAVLWSAAYFLVGRALPSALMRPFVFGALYGIVVHLVMSLVVIPLSRTPRRPFAWQPWLIQLPIHIAFVGLPIALVQSWWLRR
jgi:uncharacterized membrane protein YagU involved in acid resistance